MVDLQKVAFDIDAYDDMERILRQALDVHMRGGRLPNDFILCFLVYFLFCC